MKKPTPCIQFHCKVVFLLLCVFSFYIAGIEAQVNTRVDYLRHAVDSTEILQVRWAPADEQDWHNENDGRLDIMGLLTTISSEELHTSLSGTTQYQFDFPSSAVVELLVDITRLAPDEELYLWDTKHREIIFDLSSQTKKRFLTSPFNPSQTVLIWTSQSSPAYQSHFTIDHIYYDRSLSDRSSGIGFGTALPCHPNAACKQDSMFQLISNSSVRMRLVMDEGIGWCTGSFVNNTRNDKTPYLLTAFHCQFEYTPFYDMWRFDLQYKSETCLNPPTEPQYFSITGCELKALGQASDFLLVQVTGQIPLNQSVTFAGWNKDEATIPDTTYLIHHPNADIRKISSCVNDAVVHPNQIGWSEGYTTPANHHFRLKFTEGGHEPGSSGGPVFNEGGLLVGQLHGGTAGCEDVNSAFVGRIAKSWNLGQNAQGRLGDWLDPDSTGISTLASIENVNPDEIVDIHGIIKDPEGRPVRNTIVKITGSIDQSLTTSEEGTFLLTGVNRNGQYTITPEKKENPLNGLSAVDLLAIQKHLLSKDTFDFAWQHIAADATNNQQTTVGDIVLLLKLLLGKIQTLPSSPSWRFDPPVMVIDSFPAGEPVEIQITGIKIGDVNGSADPNQ